MKPMLKTAFFSAVKSLLKDGVKPYFRAANFGKLGLIEFVGTNGNTHVEQVYSCAWYSAERMSARFQGWFYAAVAEFHAEAAERLEDGDKVLDGETVRTVTGFRNIMRRSANGTPRDLKRTGVVILDDGIEANAGDLKPVVFNDVPADQLIETQWTDMTITHTVSDDRMQSAVGKGVITSAFQAYSIAFDWKIEFGGEGYPATLSFVGEPSITSPLCHCRCDDLLLVLETVDEKLGLLDVIHDKLATWTRYPITERLKTSGA
ncbi:hypothetical protein [Citrobacter werkmanii]|uniref:hypothetical protein n=1 Tax=Citrobacter werkmanii TaxID=67827 RepID=UPI0037C90E6D